MQYDNPARRLHRILTKALDVSATQGAPNSVSSVNVWKAVFNESDDENFPTDLDGIHTLIKLTRDAICRLQKVGDQNIYLKVLDELSMSVHQCGLLSSQWNLVHSGLSKPLLLDMIAATADQIDNESNLFELTQEQQKDLLNSAQALLDEICKSDVDRELKIYLMVRLEEICTAIRHYSIDGSDGLSRIVEANIGGAVLKSIRLADESREKTLYKRFFELMLKFASLLGIAADVNGFLLPSVIEISKLLPPGK
jgi:hypothetical protein